MRKALATFLLLILPLQWAWATDAIDCRHEAVSAVEQPAPPDTERGTAQGAAGSHDCCAQSEPADVQCSSDCSSCHGPGVMALASAPAIVGVAGNEAGDTRYRSPAPKHITTPPLRPPRSSSV